MMKGKRKTSERVTTETKCNSKSYKVNPLGRSRSDFFTGSRFKPEPKPKPKLEDSLDFPVTPVRESYSLVRRSKSDFFVGSLFKPKLKPKPEPKSEFKLEFSEDDYETEALDSPVSEHEGDSPVTPVRESDSPPPKLDFKRDGGRRNFLKRSRAFQDINDWLQQNPSESEGESEDGATTPTYQGP